MTEAEKYSTLIEKIPQVYEAGKNAGGGGGYSEGYEAGKQDEHSSFWNSYLNDISMNHFFSGSGWTDENFYPNQNLIPRHAYMMFRDTGITDVWGRMEELGFILDFSTCTNFYNAFYGYKGTWHGVIDMSKVSTGTECFRNNSNLVEIKKLIVSENTTFGNNFTGCDNLEKMPVEGTIGKTGFNVSPCVKLNKASNESIINALSSTTIGLTVTISKAAKEAAFTDEEWATLVATKPNWTIALM